MMRGLILWLVGLALGGLFFVGEIVVSADVDLDTALKSTPQGIPLKRYFEIGNSRHNHAAVVKSRNSEAQNTDVVQLTDDTDQVGTIWSTESNPFDLGREQVISMWLYFGNRGSASTDQESPENNRAGDGMAFVLQNDPRGTAATTKMPPLIMRGENLGVWGFDDGAKDDEALTRLANSAIQSSWALEFDTHLNAKSQYNDLTSWGDSYDWNGQYGGLRFPHIASNYPSRKESYQRDQVYRAWYATDWRPRVSLKHDGLIAGHNFNFLSNGSWHHLTIRYEPERHGNADVGDMTYIFDDKDPITGAPQAGRSQNVAIFKSQITDEAHPHTARWGFTGATGENYENNLVVFDQVPDLVDVSAQANLTDLSQQKSVHEGDTVKEGDQVKLDYTAKYIDGKSDWHDVVAHLKLPRHIAYRGGTITYAGGAQETVEILPQGSSQITLVRKLARALNKDYSQVKISLDGEVETGAAQVATTTSNFNGFEAVAEATVPSFKVEPLQYLNLNLTSPLTQTIDEGDQVKLTGQVTMLEEDRRNSDLTFHVAVNGREVAQTILPDEDPLGVIDQTVATALLDQDKNAVTVWVTDTQQHVSNKVSLTAFLGRLALKSVTDCITFKGQLNGQRQRLIREQPFEVTVEDTRSASDGWHLEATATPLRQNHRPLAGQLIYVAGKDTKFLTSSDAQSVLHHHHAEGSTETVTRLKDDVNTGLLLQVDAGAVAGTYSGTITWALCNTP